MSIRENASPLDIRINAIIEARMSRRTLPTVQELANLIRQAAPELSAYQAFIMASAVLKGAVAQ